MTRRRRALTNEEAAGGCWQDAVWPGCKVASAVPKVLAANFVCDPVLFFPAFYTLKEMADPAVPILQSLSNPLHTTQVRSRYRRRLRAIPRTRSEALAYLRGFR
jgi:hypothetical protein